MKANGTIILLATILAGCASGLNVYEVSPISAQSQLPPCPTGWWVRRHMCFGTIDNGFYVGEFRDDKFHGQGIITYVGGGRYVGWFRDGQEHGLGSHTDSTGLRYVGEWRYRLPDGQGAEFSSHGSLIRNGIWRNGNFVGYNSLPNPVFFAQQRIADEQGRQQEELRRLQELQRQQDERRRQQEQEQESERQRQRQLQRQQDEQRRQHEQEQEPERQRQRQFRSF
jgi:hypothetical protein